MLLSQITFMGKLFLTMALASGEEDSPSHEASGGMTLKRSRTLLEAGRS